MLLMRYCYERGQDQTAITGMRICSPCMLDRVLNRLRCKMRTKGESKKNKKSDIMSCSVQEPLHRRFVLAMWQ